MKILFKEDFNLIKSFFSVAKLKKSYVYTLFLSSFLGHGLELIQMFFIANIIQGVTDKNAEMAYSNLVIYLILGLLEFTAWTINYWMAAKNSDYTYTHTRMALQEKIMTYRSNFSEKKSMGEILNASNEISEIALIIDDISEMLMDFLRTIFLIYVFLKYNLLVGLLTIIVSLAYAWTLDNLNTRMVKAMRGQIRYKDKLTDDLRQIIGGLSEIKQFFIHEKISVNTQKMLSRRSEYYLLKHKWRSIREGLIPAIIFVVKIILYLVFCIMAFNGHLEVGSLVLLISYYDRMGDSTKSLMHYSRSIRERSVVIERVKNILNYSGVDRFEFGNNDMDDISGIVRFDKVDFKYRDSVGGRVEKVSFVAEPNEITAIVGRSGSGKTTLMNLLLRKNKIDSGKITIDGIDIFDYTNEVYAKNVTLVDQTPFMFNASIRNNLGLVDNNLKRQKEACKRVGIHNFIMRLPNGYNTILRDGGKVLNTSQMQLLAIARAILTRAEILLFDEATAMIDPTMSADTIKMIEDLKNDHTVILITHDKESMKVADKIIVIDEGNIVGEGNHEQLMAKNVYYKNIQDSSYVKPEEDVAILTGELNS